MMTHNMLLTNVADWHADKACHAYHRGELDDYCRHIAICDRLRDLAAFLQDRRRALEMAS